MEPKELLSRYYKKASVYKYNKNIRSNRKGFFVQDSSNCWLYSMANNVYFNTGIIVDIEKVKAKIKSWGGDTQNGSNKLISALAICEVYSDKGLIIRELSVLKNTKLLADMLKVGYRFAYSRYHNDEMKEDIREEDILDNIIRKKDGRHATNIGFSEGFLREDGTRVEKNILDTFSYKTTDIFIKSVRSGGIDDSVLFIDVDPNFRKLLLSNG